MDLIFTITACGRGNQFRTWGWWANKVEAELALRAENNDLIFESGTFTHAVIEAVPPGLMGGLDTGRERWWFRAEYRGGGDYAIVPLESTPQEFGGLEGFGLG